MLRIPFGRYRGEPLDRVPPDYWAWLADHEDTSDTWRAIAKKQLGIDLVVSDEIDQRPADQRPAAIMFPRVAFTWGEVMRAEFADDRAALSIVERGAAVLKELCEAITGRRFPTPEELAAARAELRAEAEQNVRKVATGRNQKSREAV